MALFKSSLIFSSFQDYNEEVEKLRREVQRYRMELSNRDNNFNRMFTDGQQLMVDPRAGKIAITQQQVLAAGPTQSKSEPVLGNREKSFSYAFVQSLDESVSTEGSRVAVTFVVKHVLSTKLHVSAIYCMLNFGGGWLCINCSLAYIFSYHVYQKYIQNITFSLIYLWFCLKILLNTFELLLIKLLSVIWYLINTDSTSSSNYYNAVFVKDILDFPLLLCFDYAWLPLLIKECK